MKIIAAFIFGALCAFALSAHGQFAAIMSMGAEQAARDAAVTSQKVLEKVTAIEKRMTEWEACK